MSHVLPQGRVRVPDTVVHRAFEHETVLLNLDTGQYHGLNQVGARMLALLEETGDSALTAQTVAGEYDAPPERVAGDLAELLRALTERGLVVIDPPPDER